jgi:hypothetical protein
MGLPVTRSVGTHVTGSAGTIALAVPAGVAANDIIVIPIYVDTGVTITGYAAGFVEAPNSPVAIPPGGGQHSVHVVWKRATGADSGTYTFTLSASTFRAGSAIAYSGCVTTGSPWDTVGGVPTASTATATTNSTVSPPLSYTTAGPNRKLFYVSSNWASGAWTPPTGMTELMDAGDHVHTADDLDAATAGTYGPYSATCVGSDKRTAWLGALIGASSGLAVTMTGVASASAVGRPVVTAGAVTVSPTGAASASAIGQPAVTAGAVTVSPTGAASASAVGQPVVAPGAVGVGVVGVPSSSAVGQPTVEPGPVTVSPIGVTSASAVGTPDLVQNVIAAGVASASAVGQPAVEPGAVTIAVVGVASAGAVGAPDLVQNVIPAGVPSGSAVGVPAVEPGATTVDLVGVDSSSAVGQPVVFVGQLIAPVGVPSGSAVGAPAVSVGAHDIAAVGVPSSSAVGQPVVAAGPSVVALVGVVSSSVVGLPLLYDPDNIFRGERLFPNAQKLLVEAIASFPGVAGAGTETPPDFTGKLPFVRVTGGGGPADQVNSFPVIDLDVFGDEYHATNLLARRLQIWLMGPPPPIWQLDRVVCDQGPRELPWAEDGGPHRFGLAFRLTARRHLEV